MTAPQQPRKRQSPMLPGSAPSRVYGVVKAAGREGITRTKVVEHPDLSDLLARRIDHLLWELGRKHYVQRTKQEGEASVYRVTADCAVPLLERRNAPEPKKGAVLVALADYPGGVSESLLAEDLDCNPCRLRRPLEAIRREGLAEQVTLPDSSGGGTVWRLCSPEAATPSATPQGTLQVLRRATQRPGGYAGLVAEPRAVALPVVEVDIDAIHRGPAPFACELADDFTLRVNACNVTLTLKPEHTRMLIAAIDARLADAADARRQEYAG